jgi:putative transposase
MEKFKGRYRISSTRLVDHDYASNAMYFITLCTKGRNHFFGQIARKWEGDAVHGGWGEAFLLPSEMGRVAAAYWQEIPLHYPAAVLYEVVVMPDHMHGVVLIDNPIQPVFKANRFGPQSRNLPAIIRGFKSSVKRYANLHRIPFEWQALYHDRIIRDERELDNVRRYILNNPRKWNGPVTLIRDDSPGGAGRAG